MPKHKRNGYPRKQTLGKMGDRFRLHFSKDDAETIFEAAEEGKELVFKLTSDPSTLKEKSIVLLLEPLEPTIMTSQEARETPQEVIRRRKEVEKIFRSGDPKKILTFLRPLIDIDSLSEEEASEIIQEELTKNTKRIEKLIEKENKKQREALVILKNYEEMLKDFKKKDKTTGEKNE